MKAVSKIALLICLGFASLLQSQQQSLYTNYLLNNYAYNPAVAGAKPYTQANMYYRNQWTGFDGAPKTYLLSLYGPLKKAKGVALGGMVISDKAGLITTNTGYLTFAYHVKVSKKLKFGLGLSGGLKQYTVRLYDVRAYDKGDQYLEGSSTLNANVFDANAGLYLYGERFFFGLSSMNMLNNKITWKDPTGKLVPHYYATIGYNIKLNKEFSLQPSVMFKYLPIPKNPGLGKRAEIGQLDYSLKLTYKNMVWIGGNYRSTDGVGAMLGVTVIKKLNIAYAYDYSLSSIKKYNQGSHEICLNYNFIKKKVVSAEDDEMKIKDNSIRQSLKNKKPESGDKKPEETKPDTNKENNSSEPKKKESKPDEE